MTRILSEISRILDAVAALMRRKASSAMNQGVVVLRRV